jgi:CRP-like cAMP-binding protein
MDFNNIYAQSLMSLMQQYGDRVQLTIEEMTLLAQHMQLNTFEKNELLVAVDEVENRVHFIAEGITRSFFKKGEKDISFEFFFPGMFISSYASFLMRTPSGHAIEAFTPLTVLSLSHDSVTALHEVSNNFQQFSRVLTEELFRKTSERNKDLLSLTATERYEKLLHLNPHYVQQIPLKYLASYLNVTPESLSRIRKSI